MAAWRPASRRLVVVVREPVQERQPVQARISVLGLGVGATILGTAVSASPHPVGVELELEPDELRMRTLERLVEVAAGARVDYQRRAPRLLAEVPAVVSHGDRALRTTTFAVSDNGCGLAWSEPMPAVGTPLEIHLGTGSQVASFCGEVCWTSPFGRAPTLGLRFAAGDRQTWGFILAELKRAGAPPA
jgi:hypothetical protein